jgi:hypothetical protein
MDGRETEKRLHIATATQKNYNAHQADILEEGEVP